MASRTVRERGYTDVCEKGATRWYMSLERGEEARSMRGWVMMIHGGPDETGRIYIRVRE